jgi:hypothetical protein
LRLLYKVIKKNSLKIIRKMKFKKIQPFISSPKEKWRFSIRNQLEAMRRFLYVL